MTSAGAVHPGLWAERYSRQTVLPGFGPEGQSRLARRCVVLSGDPAAARVAGAYLTAAGLGRLLVSEELAADLDRQNDLTAVDRCDFRPATDGTGGGSNELVATSPFFPGRFLGAVDGTRVELSYQAAAPFPAASGLGSFSRRGQGPSTLASGPDAWLAANAAVILGCRLAAAVLLALVGDEPPAAPVLAARRAGWDLARLRFGEEADLSCPGGTGLVRRPAAGGGHVLLVGAGGLGSGAAWGLAAAFASGALGTALRLTVVDADAVEQSNLPRQVLHRPADVGRPKADSAVDAVRRIAPGLQAAGLRTRVAAETVDELLAGADVAINAVDNFPARYLINDACVRRGIPLVEAGVLRYSGLVMLADPPAGPCYRCLFPVPPAPDSTPDPAAAGVLGPLAGLAGGLEALFAAMLLRGDAGPAHGKLLVLDAERDAVRAVRLSRDPHCPACGGRGGDRPA